MVRWISVLLFVIHWKLAFCSDRPLNEAISSDMQIYLALAYELFVYAMNPGHLCDTPYTTYRSTYPLVA